MGRQVNVDIVKSIKITFVGASRDNNELQEFNITVPDENTKVIYINGQSENRFTLHEVYDSYAKVNSFAELASPPERDYTYRPDDIRVKQLFERGEISSAAYKKHTEKKEAYTDFHCSYCSYKDYCHSEQGDMSIGAEPDPQPDHTTHGGL